MGKTAKAVNSVPASDLGPGKRVSDERANLKRLLSG